jgi:hypothetical protein
MIECPACKGTGVRPFPTPDGMEDYPCPCCTPWPEPFPGESYRGADGSKVWIIRPSHYPHTCAEWVGWQPKADAGRLREGENQNAVCDNGNPG